MNKAPVFAAGAALSLAIVATAGSARAQAIPDSDWRQEDRHEAVLNAASPQHFAFEVRFGTYSPNIDSAKEFQSLPAAKRPYAAVFGDHCPNADGSPCTAGATHPKLYFGLEFDFLPVRIPWVGAIGIGLGWGFTNQSATSVFTAGPNVGQASGETTSLTIMPMHASIVLRADEIMRRTGVPLVPYGKFGLSMDYWHASTDAGGEVFNKSSTVQIGANGFTPGLHMAVGGMLSLNFVDQRASSRLDEATGVNHAYVFGEVYSDNVAFGTNVMQVGTMSWVAGLAIDM